MVSHLGLHRSLQQLLGQLFEQPGFPDEIFRILESFIRALSWSSDMAIASSCG